MHAQPVSIDARLVDGFVYTLAMGAVLVLSLLLWWMLSLSPATMYPFVLMVGLVPLTGGIATYVARGRVAPALGLVALSGIVASLLLDGPLQVAAATSVPAAGALLGLALAREWHYGRAVAVVSGAILAPMVVLALVGWDEWNAAFREAFVQAQKLAQADETASADRVAQMEAVLTAFHAHWPALGLGMLGGFVLIEVCVLASCVAWVSRYFLGRPGFASGFSELRPPDALVWALIALAGCWFIDYQWDSPVLRQVAGNGGILLAVIYGLNGASVLAYFYSRLRPPLLAVMAVVVVLWLLGVGPVLVFIGLFDTWGEFRLKVVEIVARARERAENAEDDER